jgi:hypothetical protein
VPIKMHMVVIAPQMNELTPNTSSTSVTITIKPIKIPPITPPKIEIGTSECVYTKFLILSGFCRFQHHKYEYTTTHVGIAIITYTNHGISVKNFPMGVKIDKPHVIHSFHIVTKLPHSEIIQNTILAIIARIIPTTVPHFNSLIDTEIDFFIVHLTMFAILVTLILIVYYLQ